MMQASPDTYRSVLSDAGPAGRSVRRRSRPVVSPILTLDVGYRLLALVDDRIHGSALSALDAQSQRVARELGLARPLLRIRPDFDLPLDYCRASINGVPVAGLAIHAQRRFCISLRDEEQRTRRASRLCRWDCRWMDSEDTALVNGKWVHVQSPEECLASWVGNLLHDHGHLLLSHEDLEARLKVAKQCEATLVRRVVPRILDVSHFGLLLRHLARWRLPTADTVALLKVLAAHANRGESVDHLAAAARDQMFRQRVEQVASDDGAVPVVRLTSAMTAQLVDLAIEYPHTSRRCSTPVRSAMRQLLGDACDHIADAARGGLLIVPSVLFDWFVALFGYNTGGMHVTQVSTLPVGYRPVTIGTLQLRPRRLRRASIKL